MTTFTAQQIIDMARVYTDREGADNGVTDAQLLPWLNARYTTIRRRLADAVPDLFTAREDFTITSGSTHDITADDFGKVLKVERLLVGRYIPLQVVPLLSAEGAQGYRLRGTTLDFFPSASAAGDYRLTYLTKPETAIGAVEDELTLPDGAEDVLALEVAARIQPRVQQDGSTFQAMAAAQWVELAESLVDQYRATPQQIAEVY